MAANKKKGIKVYFSNGVEAVVEFPHTIEEFKKQLDKAVENGSDWFVYKDGMVCISQIVFAQEVESEEAEDVDDDTGE